MRLTSERGQVFTFLTVDCCECQNSRALFRSYVGTWRMQLPPETSVKMSEELPHRLSAKYRETFAFATVSGRLPVILTQVIDTVYKYRKEAVELHGQEGADDCKAIVGKLSALKNQMQTDKPLDRLCDGRSDVALWNGFLEAEIRRRGAEGPPRWFQSSWLYVECYMYRAINEAIALSKHLKTFDPYEVQKRSSLLSSHSALLSLAAYLEEAEKGPASFQTFAEFVQISLWGNRCDLSISAGKENFQKTSPVALLSALQAKILVNDLPHVWQTLSRAVDSAQGTPGRKVRLDVVLDNAGFEVFSDLVLVDFLLQVKLIDCAHFHLKAMPWFVSDVVQGDWDWVLQQLEADPDKALSGLGVRFRERVAEGTCVLHAHPFWTTCFDYSEMRRVAPDLYQQLSGADLILFKGDLNYRKLVGDRSWPHTTPFEESLCGFHPAPLCTLRALKGDVVVGLREGLAQEKQAESDKWMVSGEFAVIQYCGTAVSLDQS